MQASKQVAGRQAASKKKKRDTGTVTAIRDSMAVPLTILDKDGDEQDNF